MPLLFHRCLLHRRLPLLILLCWMAPSVGAAATVMHVALEHYPAHAGEHQHLGQGPEQHTVPEPHSDGHRHELVANLHAHPAMRTASMPLPEPMAAVASTLPLPTAASDLNGDRSTQIHSTRFGPPAALFTSHCALLL